MPIAESVGMQMTLLITNQHLIQHDTRQCT
jgi:hypothetical protein